MIIPCILYHSGLYATEYKKEHSHITVGEYRAIWDGLDNKTRKVCSHTYFFSSLSTSSLFLDLRTVVQGEKGREKQERFGYRYCHRRRQVNRW